MTQSTVPVVDRSIGVQAAESYLTKKEYDAFRRTTKCKEWMQDIAVLVIIIVTGLHIYFVIKSAILAAAMP